jgi:hypothetical protein
VQQNGYAIPLRTLVVQRNAIISLLSERVIINSSGQRTVILMSALGFIMLHSRGIHHFLDRWITFNRVNVIYFGRSSPLDVNTTFCQVNG